MSGDLNHQTRAQHHLDRAVAALEAELPDQALTELEACLKVDPGNLAARLAQARAALAVNRPRQALSALDCADLYHPDRRDTPELNLLRAQTLTRCHLDEMACGPLNQLVEQFPDDLRPRRMLAELHLRRGQLDEAINQLRHVVRLAPSDDGNRRTLAELLQRRDPEAAVDLLFEVDLTESDPVTQLLAARLCQGVDRLRDAHDLYDHLLRTRPDDVTVWLEAGKLADAVGDDALARRRLERAAVLTHGSQAEVRQALALAHMHAGRNAAAGRCWWQLTREMEQPLQAWAGLLVCALACDRPKLALHADQALDGYPPTERRAALARLWPHAAGGTVISQTLYEAAPQPAEPDSPLEDLLTQAVDTLALHVEAFPARADSHYHLAQCSNALGQTRRADQATQTALKLNPDYRSAHDLASQLAEAA